MAKVGIIRVSESNPSTREKLVAEIQHWLEKTGWGAMVSVSVHKRGRDRFVDFIPGRFQTNGPKRIALATQSAFADFELPLRKWLWELE